MSVLVDGQLVMESEREAALVRFLWDVEETVTAMEQGLARLSDEGASLEVIEELYYLAYRTREGALAAGLEEVSELARVIENVFEHARRGQVEMTSDLISLLTPSCVALRRMTTEGVGAEESVEACLGAAESDVTDAAVSSF